MTVLIKSIGIRPPQSGQTYVHGTPTRSAGCNAQCYDAKGEVCYCVCGGKNHGIGLEKAIENTKQMLEEGNLQDVTYNEEALELAIDPTVVSELVVESEPINFNAIGADVAMAESVKVNRPRDAKGHFIKQVKEI